MSCVRIANSTRETRLGQWAAKRIYLSAPVLRNGVPRHEGDEVQAEPRCEIDAVPVYADGAFVGNMKRGICEFSDC